MVVGRILSFGDIGPRASVLLWLLAGIFSVSYSVGLLIFGKASKGELVENKLQSSIT